jgi:predicted PurR-regulated permease PerM
MKAGTLPKVVQVLLLISLTYLILVIAKPFLVPVVFAALFSMLMLPLSMKMENAGVKRGLATLICILVLIFAFSLVASLLAWQISDLSKNAENIEKNIGNRINEIREFATNTLGISQEKQEEIIDEQKAASNSRINAFVKGGVTYMGMAVTKIVLVIVYIFLFMYFRTHLKKFVLMRVQSGQQEKARDIMQNGRKVAQKYLTGLAFMIAALWIMYFIGFSIAGVKNAFFFAILCGLLEIVPFVGNLFGVIITLLVSLAQGSDTTVLVGIIITYGIVQFFQTYFLEPLVVGREVNVHPLFTILGLVAGEFVWGIPGMILAIPVMGVTKIIFDHIEPLRPYGFLLGEEKSHDGSGIVQKIKGLFGKRN